MNKTLLIFRHEFLLTIKGVGFIIMTLIVPVLALLGIGAFELASTLSRPPQQVVRVIGYVDETGMFDNHSTQGPVRLIPFASQEEATQALVARNVTEYFVIPGDYLSSGRVQRYTLEKELTTPPAAMAAVKSFLTANLLDGKVPQDIIALIVSPLNLEVTRITDQGERAEQQSNIGNIIIPGVFALLLALALMFGTNSLISGLGEEKESRLIEVLFSSVSVRQLLVGKVFALGLAGLLQVLVWLISAPLLLSLASSTFGGFLSRIQIPGNFIVLGSVYFVLGYLLFAVLSVGVGAISADGREGSQLAMIYVMLGFVPLWFSSLLIAFPNSPVWTVLTLFPVTAPVQTMLRLGVSDIPTWQIVTGIGVLGVSIVVGLFLSIRIFRVYMLMYGKRPALGEVVRNLRNT